MGTIYTQDGVDVKEGDDFSKYAAALCRTTYENSAFVEVRDFSKGHFRGPRGLRLRKLPRNCWLDITPDGDGTKVVLVDAAGDYDNAAYGWVAMTCGDVTRWGGMALALVNNLDTTTLGKNGDEVNNAFRRMITSVKRIADEQKLVMFKGETAELPGCVESPNPTALAKYLWSGVALGVYNPKTIITGDDVEAGMSIMGLRDPGLGNNGISSARKAIAMKFGQNWGINPDAREAIKQAATPTPLYDRFLSAANGWFTTNFKPVIPMHLIVHVTGGAIKSKLAEDILFPRGLSADLDKLWDPPQIMRQCAEWRGMDDEQCLDTWHCGQRVLVVISSGYEAHFIDMAAVYGHEAKRVGNITRRPKTSVLIQSKFTGKPVEWFA